MTDADYPWKAAFIDLDITPSEPTQLQGMAGPPRITDQIAIRLSMQLLALQDESGAKGLLVAADLFGFEAHWVKGLQNELTEMGYASRCVLMNASHTHYGPGVVSRILESLGTADHKYLDFLRNKIIQALKKVVFEDCSVSWGSTDARIGLNRRIVSKEGVEFGPNPRGFYESKTPFLFLNWRRRKQRVVVVNHGCHPTGLGSTTNVIHGEFPAIMRRRLMDSGAVEGAMFLQGAAGDSKQTLSDGSEFCSDHESVKQNGEYLADQIIDALEQNQLEALPPRFEMVDRSIEIPLREMDEAEWRRWSAKMERLFPWSKGWADQHLKLDQIEQGLTIQSSVWVLGNRFVLVSLSGEPLAELGRKIRALFQSTHPLMVLGYTNGLDAYLPDEKALAEGGYEREATSLVYLQRTPLRHDYEEILLGAIHQMGVEIGATMVERPDGK